jgi:hypothetical protein
VAQPARGAISIRASVGSQRMVNPRV